MRSQLPFGLHYLEHEPLHFTSPTGRVWKVYGSPVSPPFSRVPFLGLIDPCSRQPHSMYRAPSSTNLQQKPEVCRLDRTPPSCLMITSPHQRYIVRYPTIQRFSSPIRRRMEYSTRQGKGKMLGARRCRPD